MKPSENCFAKLKKFEGCVLHAYPDPATKDDPIKKGEPWTIGYGSTYYEDGTPVKKGDVITQARAEALLERDCQHRLNEMSKYIHSTLNQNQIDALISFCYNEGIGNFRTSTLLIRVNMNPSDPSIRKEFMKYIYANHKVLDNLQKRRAEEANLYFTPIN